MTIKQYGGIFGRNPDFKSLTLSGGSSLSHYSEGTWTPDPQDTSGNSGSSTVFGAIRSTYVTDFF